MCDVKEKPTLPHSPERLAFGKLHPTEVLLKRLELFGARENRLESLIESLADLFTTNVPSERLQRTTSGGQISGGRAHEKGGESE